MRLCDKCRYPLVHICGQGWECHNTDCPDYAPPKREKVDDENDHTNETD